jgi:hypothetical protein
VQCLRRSSLKDQITIGHALLIAKLPPSQQHEAFTAGFRGMWTSEGNTQVLIPVRELAAWIESNILLQLASVPFDKQDETLVREFSFALHQVKQAIEPHLSFQQTLYSWNQMHRLERKSHATGYFNWRNGIPREHRSKTDRLEPAACQKPTSMPSRGPRPRP